MLAQHRDEAGFDVRVLALPIPLNAYPLVGPFLQEEVLSIDGKVVLRLASDHAGLAPGTFIQIHHHAPFVIYATSYHFLPRRYG